MIVSRDIHQKILDAPAKDGQLSYGSTAGQQHPTSASNGEVAQSKLHNFSNMFNIR